MEMHTQPQAFADPAVNVREAGLVRRGMSVADFGAGSGAYTFALAAHVGEEGKVYAVDIQKDLLARIRSKAMQEGLKQIETVWGDIDEVKGSCLSEEIVDVVFASNILFQLENKEAALMEMHRVIKNNGHLVLIDWEDSFAGLGPPQEEVITLARARTMADVAGFAAAREFNAGAHHWGLVCKKIVK